MVLMLWNSTFLGRANEKCRNEEAIPNTDGSSKDTDIMSAVAEEDSGEEHHTVTEDLLIKLENSDVCTNHSHRLFLVF